MLPAATVSRKPARLGGELAAAMAAAVQSAEPLGDVPLACLTARLDLPLRRMPSPAQAEADLRLARERLQELRCQGAIRSEIRTAECDCFGAEECVTLTRAAAAGQLEEVRAILPAEVSVVRIGPRWLVGWPGEAYAEFALALKSRYANAHVISLANGELQGYLVTAEAVRQRHYEALNAVLASPESGDLLVQTTLELLNLLEKKSDATGVVMPEPADRAAERTR